jgi:hypothetical protein
VNKLRTSRLAYHLAIGTLTEACLLVLGALLIAPFGVRGSGIIVLLVVFLADGLIYIGFAGIASKWGAPTDLTAPIVGRAPGRLVGLYVGAVIGAYFAGTPGIIVGGIAFFFGGRLLGSWLALRIAASISRHFSLQEPVPPPRLSPNKARRVVDLYFYGLPLGLAFIAALLRLQGISSDTNLGSMPAVQIAALAYSVLMLALIPALGRAFQRRLRSDPRLSSANTLVATEVLSKTVAEVPAIVGFALLILGAQVLVGLAFGLLTIVSLAMLSRTRRQAEEPAA